MRRKARGSLKDPPPGSPVESHPPKKGGDFDIGRVVRATVNSLRGLRVAWQHQIAFRQELAAALVLIPVAVWQGDSGLERAVLIAVLILVLIAELINSAIESVVDRVGTEFHELSGRAKDLGSAVVLLAILNAAIVWALILFT